MFEMSEITALMGSSTLLMVAELCSLGVSICTMLAIGFDCKSKNVKSRTTYMVLAFFFPIIVAIVYLCNKSKYKMAADEQEIPEREKNAKSGKICTIIAVIMLVASLVLSAVSAVSMVKNIMNSDILGDIMDTDAVSVRYGYELDGKTVYYDMNGKVYENSYEVPFYDKDGNPYTYGIDDVYNEVLVDKDNKAYDYYDAFVGIDGYLVFDDTYSFTIDENMNYSDAEGNIYYLAGDVSWNADGKLVDNYTGEPIR